MAGEEHGKGLPHRLAIFDHVGNSRRAAAVVFEDEVFPLVITNEIRSADMNVDVFGRTEIHHLLPEVFSRHDDLPGNDPVLDDLLVVVDVVKKEVQGGDSLDQPFLQRGPFAGGNDSWNHVEGEDLFGALFVPVNSEGDALIEESQVDRLLPSLEFLFAQVRKGCDQF